MKIAITPFSIVDCLIYIFKENAEIFYTNSVSNPPWIFPILSIDLILYHLPEVKVRVQHQKILQNLHVKRCSDGWNCSCSEQLCYLKTNYSVTNIVQYNIFKWSNGKEAFKFLPLNCHIQKYFNRSVSEYLERYKLFTIVLISSTDLLRISVCHFIHLLLSVYR